MKPCPFCGSTDIEEGEALSERNGRKYSQAGCTNCGALGPDRFIESSRAWNIRK